MNKVTDVNSMFRISLLLIAMSMVFAARSGSQTSLPGRGLDVREDSYRSNNLGVAHLEQFNYKRAIENFRKAIELEPSNKFAHVNLAIALFNSQELDDAVREAHTASLIAPNFPQPYYIDGLVARSQNRPDDAIENFKKVLSIDASDVGSNINLGQVYIQQRRYDQAVRALRAAVASEPYNSTALYNLANTLNRIGQREEGEELMSRFQELRRTGAATSIGQNYFEQGRYAEAVTSTGAESDLVDKTVPNVVFRNVTVGLPERYSKRSVESFDRAASLIDFDGDGDLDIAQTSPARLFRNDRGKFTDVTRSSGDFAKRANVIGHSIIAGDYNNDGKSDLFVSWRDRFALYRNIGRGRFVDATANSKLPRAKATARSSAFADFDHDGDLDLIVSTLENVDAFVFRNNGNGTFTDVSKIAFGDVKTAASQIVPTDFDNRRDMDFLLVPLNEPPILMRNMRNGSFRDVAEEVGLNKQTQLNCVAAGDFNKDSYVDFFFGRPNAVGIFAVSNGRGGFIYRNAPNGTFGATSALFMDYDNDGLLDLVADTTSGMVVSRNLGDVWSDAAHGSFKTDLDLSASQELLAADLDADGDLDLLVYANNGTLQYLRNDGGNANHSETVRLTGRVSNKTAVGTKVDIRAGSLSQKLESFSASPMPAPSEILFGLGKRAAPDVVRVIWPSGVIQAEIEFPARNNKFNARRLTIEELDRKPSSCPYLYVWNGERFEFITDFLGGGEMGNWAGPDVYHQPDPDEYVRIAPDKLKSKDGRYELRVTNELEEVLFIDQLKLVAIEHDEDSEVYPNEGLGAVDAQDHLIYTTASEHPPLAAADAQGNNVLDKIAKMDRQFYGSFKPSAIRGYSHTHSLTLRLDDKVGYSGRTLLLLSGWTDYAFSSDNVAASQSGKSLTFPKLQVRDGKGQWRTVIDSIGISVGRPQTVVVDLTGKFLTASREVRIITNLKTYWDRIAVDTSEPRPVKTFDLNLSSAVLRDRGYSKEIKFRGMAVPDYENVVNDGRWKYFSGTFTRVGDVLPLLNQIDDSFVISKTGDELALSFAALPAARKGKKYTFLLFGDGYSKEMDINSGSPDAVLPLPYKAMKRYPYFDENFEMNNGQQRLYDEYTTRIVEARLPRIETALIQTH